jgi:hypothetical protein
MLRATEATIRTINKSFNNYDETLFRKWFGENNDLQTDLMVHTRIRNTYKFMKDGYEKKWDTICCHNRIGACEGC